MKVFTVIGTSNSGKTTTIEAAVAELKRRGFRVGSVKEIHYEAFAIDPLPTSNTRRHRAAGAELVTARGYGETDMLYPGKLPMKEILRHYKDYDWVALEGVDDLCFPAIICAHDIPGLELKWRGTAIAVAGRISSGQDEYKGLPIFNVLNETEELGDFLLKNVPDFLECYDPDEAASGIDITLEIDGATIRMVPFVQKILRNAVMGVVKELEGYKEGAEVVLRLD